MSNAKTCNIKNTQDNILEDVDLAILGILRQEKIPGFFLFIPKLILCSYNHYYVHKIIPSTNKNSIKM